MKLLTSDANRSNKEELTLEEGLHSFKACNHHRAVYESNVVKRKCAIDECYTEARINKDGLRLCKLHAAKEERGKQKVPSPAFREEREEDKDITNGGDTGAQRTEPETVARSAPGLEGEESVDRDPQLLAVYVRAVLQAAAGGLKGPMES